MSLTQLQCTPPVNQTQVLVVCQPESFLPQWQKRCVHRRKPQTARIAQREHVLRTNYMTDHQQEYLRGDGSELAGVHFDNLPTDIHLCVLSLLPTLVDRVRCALVSKRWASLLAEPTFWSKLDFDGAQHGALDADLLFRLARKAAGTLRSIDINGDDWVGRPINPEYFFAVLAKEGLCGRLETITSRKGGRRGPPVNVRSIYEARALVRFCPSLSHAETTVQSTWLHVSGVLPALPPGGEHYVRACLESYYGSRQDEEYDEESRDDDPPEAPIVAITWLAVGLLARPVRVLELTPVLSASIGESLDDVPDIVMDFDDFINESDDSPEAIDCAAARLGAAIAHPVTGPRVLEINGVGYTHAPLFVQLCRHLTPESRLRNLCLWQWSPGDEGSGLSGDGALELASALGPGQSQLESLTIMWGALEDGIVCIFAALEHNSFLKELHISQNYFGESSDEGAATLALSLRSNTTLKTLDLTDSLQCGAAGLAAIFSALVPAPSSEAAAGAASGPAPTQTICPVTELKLSRCSTDSAAAAALGQSLRRGARLKRLTLRGCMGASASLAAEVASGLTAAGNGSKLRELDLSGCDIGASGANAMAKLLERPSCRLTALNLSSNNIDDSGGKALAFALEANAAQSRLMSLDLSLNALTDGTAIVFGRALGAQGRVSGAAAAAAADDVAFVAGAAAAGIADNSSGRGPGRGLGKCCSARRRLRRLMLSGPGNTFGVQGVTGLARGIEDAGKWLELIDLSFAAFLSDEEEEEDAPFAACCALRVDLRAAAKEKSGRTKGKEEEEGELESILRSAAEVWERRHRAKKERRQQGQEDRTAGEEEETRRSKTANEMLQLRKGPNGV